MKQRYYHLAIRRLHQKGMTDQEIVEHLFDLSDDAILLLERVGWNRKSIPGLLVACAGDTTWTRRRVQHFRLTQSPPLVSRRPKSATLRRARRLQRDTHASAHGWGNYVGRSAEIWAGLDDWLTPAEIAEGLGVGWTTDLVERWQERPWDELRSAEVAALDVASQRGVCLRPDLTQRYLTDRSEDVVGLLLRKGLLMRLGRLTRNGPQRYALAPGVGKHHPVDIPRLSGPDLLLRRLVLHQ